MNLNLTYVINILNNLEENIKTVVDASVPNKQQNKAAQKLAADHFWDARDNIAHFEERQLIPGSR